MKGKETAPHSKWHQRLCRCLWFSITALKLTVGKPSNQVKLKVWREIGLHQLVPILQYSKETTQLTSALELLDGSSVLWKRRLGHAKPPLGWCLKSVVYLHCPCWSNPCTVCESQVKRSACTVYSQCCNRHTHISKTRSCRVRSLVTCAQMCFQTALYISRKHWRVYSKRLLDAVNEMQTVLAPEFFILATSHTLRVDSW